MPEPYPASLSWLTWRLLWLALAVVYCAAVEVCQAAEGKASYYTVKSCQREGTSGVWTASGERYDETALTCALPHHQFGGLYKVCHRANSAPSPRTNPVCVVVRHNDYGPGRGPRRKGVVIDLSPAAFKRLARLEQGVVAVTVQKVESSEASSSPVAF